MFEQSFLDERRSEFYNSDGSGFIKRFTCVYTLDSDESETESEYDATIRDFSISGNYIIWSLLFPATGDENYTINAIRLYGADEEVLATYNVTIACNPAQSLQIVFKILYQEVATSTEEES